MAYAFVGVRRSEPDFYAAWVMNNALGQYALGGRLGDSIRERQGMAYYVYSTLDAQPAEGPLMMRAGVSGDRRRADDRLDRPASSMLVRTEGFTAKELDESKSYLVGSIPRQLETNAGIAGFLLSAEFHGLGADYDARLPRLIDAVTLEEANRVAAGSCSIRRGRSSSWPGLRPNAAVRDPSSCSGSASLSGVEGDRASHLLRRRLHADLSRSDLSGRGLCALLRRQASRSNRRASTKRWPRRRSSSTKSRSRSTTRDLFVHYTATIIEHMGGRGAGVVRAAERVYEEWASNHHFEIYDDVAPVLTELSHRAGSCSARSPTRTAASMRSASTSDSTRC